MRTSTWGFLLRLLWLGLFVSLPELGHGNEAHNQLMATSEEHRRAALQVVIGGAGERCDSVKRTFFQGEKKNGDAIWNIECDRESYSIIVAPDGKTKLISCANSLASGERRASSRCEYHSGSKTV
jgi:hypothetical protein